MIKESAVEKRLKECVESRGGETRKLRWIGRRSAPDRLILLHGAHFVEVKRPGEKPTPDQAREHERMRNQGVDVRVLDSITDVEEYVKSL